MAFFMATYYTVLMDSTDSTFDSVPALFSQLFIVHAQKHHTILPVAYCFLTSKQLSLRAYTDVLQKLKSFLSMEYEPETVFTDLKKNIHIAVKEM